MPQGYLFGVAKFNIVFATHKQDAPLAMPQGYGIALSWALLLALHCFLVIVLTPQCYSQ